MEGRAPAPLTRNRDFLLLLLGQTGSLVGSSMTTLALVMLAYSVTGSTARAGLVSAGHGVELAAMMLPAGAIVDRVDRKRVMVVTALAGAALLASIPIAALIASVTLPHLLLVAAADGALACFYNPAELAALKQVVPSARLGPAMAANQGRGAVARLLGPPLAGLLYGINRTVPFLADAATPSPPGPRPRDLVVVLHIAFTGIATTALLSLQQHGTRPRDLGLLQAGYGSPGCWVRC